MATIRGGHFEDLYCQRIKAVRASGYGATRLTFVLKHCVCAVDLTRYTPPPWRQVQGDSLELLNLGSEKGEKYYPNRGLDGQGFGRESRLVPRLSSTQSHLRKRGS